MSTDERPFFVKQGSSWRFAPPLLGQALVDEAPAAKDAGGRLYGYHDEAWMPDGETFYRRRVRELMGKSWQPRHETDAIRWIEAGAPKMDERPPLDSIRVLNGILHVGPKGATLEPLSAAPLTPVRLPVRYDPDADCPRFTKFILSTLGARSARLAQEIVGYLLVPDNSQQKAFFFQGPGGNGKSTLVQVVEALIGEDNVSSCSLKSLSDDRFAVADLYGRLVNAVADITSEELASLSTFRAITGGDRLRAERKYGHAFEFRPFTRLIFSANKFPPMRDPSNATFARWVVLPFEREFRGSPEEDKQLAAKLTTPQELSGVLNWALAGLIRLRKNGSFAKAKEADAALARFRLAADTVAMFIEDDFSTWPRGHYKRPDVYRGFTGWCKETGHQPMTRNQFYARMEAVLGEAVQSRGGHGWRVPSAAGARR